jgi:hypothetical protein
MAADEQWVIVIPPGVSAASQPMEVVGLFGSTEAAERWAVGLRLISWTVCPIMRPDHAGVIAKSVGWVARG